VLGPGGKNLFRQSWNAELPPPESPISDGLSPGPFLPLPPHRCPPRSCLLRSQKYRWAAGLVLVLLACDLGVAQPSGSVAGLGISVFSGPEPAIC